MPEQPSREALDSAFELLKNLKQGDDIELLGPIQLTVQALHNDPAGQKALEKRLIAHLGAGSSRATKDFVCRELALIGSEESVPALAALLPDESISHMARYALERIPGPAVDRALRDSLGTVKGTVKAGVINSIAVRRDAKSIPQLTAALKDSPEVAAVAAKALGEIGTSEAAKALAAFRGSAPEALRPAAADASLICAERLVASGQRSEAVAILEALNVASQPAHVRLAASRALSMATRL
jgi:HEAT repeat protein